MDMINIFVIAGAGMGGLATALALQKNGFLCQVYERDPDFNSRSQGYSLTIQKNGFEALGILGISERVKTMASDYFISKMSTYNNVGELIMSKVKHMNSKQNFNNFVISRQLLRECLINELNENTIHWNKGIIGYEPIVNDLKHVRVIFSDNTSTIARALIGCDGVRSCIRKQMIGDELNYLGIWAINGISFHNGDPFLINQTLQMIDGKARVFIKPFSKDKCMWQLTFTVSNNDEIYQELAQNNLQMLLNRAISVTKNWHKSVASLINNTSISDIRAGPIFDRNPLAKIEKDVACITMLGDAVHPMSPFKGQGANQALVDAVNLAQFLVDNRGENVDVEKAFNEFEVEMLNRSRKYVLQSRFAVEFLHTDKALSTKNMSQFVSGKLILQ